MGFRTTTARLVSSALDVTVLDDARFIDELFVLKVKGNEALSRCYEIEVVAQTTREELAPYDENKIERLLSSSLVLEIAQEVTDEVEDEKNGTHSEAIGVIAHGIHGMLREVEMLSVDQAEALPTAIGYRMVLVPRLWYASQTVQTRIYQGMSLMGIIRQVLGELGLDEDTDYRFRLDENDYPVREYTLQYNESDLQLISRLCEHEGIFFFFEQSPDREVVIFADKNEAFQEFMSLKLIDEENYQHLRYDPRGGVLNTVPCIKSLKRLYRKAPKLVSVQDYDYKVPSIEPNLQVEVTHTGVGVRHYYLEAKEYTQLDGSNPDDVTPQVGRMAVVRSQELALQRSKIQAVSTVIGLGPSMVFTLENHFDESLVWANVRKKIRHQYVVLESKFSIVQNAFSGSNEANEEFTAELTILNMSTPFRPARTTPRPSVAGVLTARVYDRVPDATPQIDTGGQYTLIFGIPTVPEGPSVRKFRMSQPFSGPVYGMHHPLHHGAEVLIAHLAGDPDRPVIIGSPPNGDNQSPVTESNATHSGFKSRMSVVDFVNDDA